MAPPPRLNAKKGSMPVLQWMRPDMLAVDPAYQRSIDNNASRALIAKITKNWDWDLCQPLIVSRRSDNSLFVVDGQHRLAAAIERNAVIANDIEQLPCFICNYGDVSEEAQRFVDFNRNRKSLKPVDLWRAALAAQEPDAMAIVAALDEAGLHVHSSSNNANLPKGAITNISGLYRILKEQGAAQLAVALDVLSQAFKGQPLQYAGTILTGIAAIVADECADEIDARKWQDGHRFGMLTECLGATEQVEWYRQTIETRLNAAGETNYRTASETTFRTAWADYTGAFEDDEGEAEAA